MAVTLDAQQREYLQREIRKRLRELRITQAEAAARSDISQPVFNRIANGRNESISERTLDGLERGLDWKEGSAERVIAGGSPVPVDGGNPLLEGHPRAVISEAADKRGRPYRRIDIFIDDGSSVADRERWIEIWDALAAQSPTRARGALRIAETLLLFPEAIDPDEW